MKKLLVFVLGICLLSCSKEETPGNNAIPREALRFVKTGVNGDIILDENIYHPDGKIKTRINYKNYTLGLIGSQIELSYEDGLLVQTEIKTDMSSSSSAIQYSFGRASFEYDNSGKAIQRNSYLKFDDEYELTSFSVFTYNNNSLPIRESRYTPDGTLYGYSTYGYDNAGNVISSEYYAITQPGASPVLRLKNNYKHDNKKNPYTNVYLLVENIPFSVNQNNITETITVNYAVNEQGTSSTSTTSYASYNSKGYPTNMNEDGNIFILQYK